MSSWEPVDIDHDGTGDEEYEWDDDAMNDLEMRFEELRQFNKKFNESSDKDTTEEMSIFIDSTRRGIEELVADQIYDKLTTLFSNTRKKLGIKGVRPIDPIRKYDNFKLADDGALSFIYKKTVIDLGNINKRIKSPSEMRKVGVTKLKLMGFTNIIDKDTQPYRKEYIKARKKLRKLDKNLDGKLKAIEPSSARGAEAIEMIEMTSQDIDTTVKDVEQDTSFIKPDDIDKLLPLRELEGLDKQLRMIRGSLKVAIAKHVD